MLMFKDPLVSQLAIAGGIFIIGFGILFIIRNMLFRLLEELSKKTATAADDLIIAHSRMPSFFLITSLGLYITTITSTLPEKYAGVILTLLDVTMIISVTMIIADLTALMLINSFKQAGAETAASGISRTIIKVTVYCIGFMILLSHLGISIAPIITTLGIGGIAVALALQKSLSDLIAGIHIVLEKPVIIGDFIMLDSGERGEVLDIGWRTTKIKKPGNNILVIPNSKLAESTITNFNMNDRKLLIQVAINVGYETDIDFFEKIILDETVNSRIPGLILDPGPILRFKEIGDFSLHFLLICHVSDFNAQFDAEDRLRRKIFKRLRIENISIPYPVRTILSGHESETLP